MYFDTQDKIGRKMKFLPLASFSTILLQLSLLVPLTQAAGVGSCLTCSGIRGETEVQAFQSCKKGDENVPRSSKCSNWFIPCS